MTNKAHIHTLNETHDTIEKQSMAGKMCPDCGEMTFHKTPTGRKCSKCQYEMKIPPHGGTGGKGCVCSNCGEHKVRAVTNKTDQWKCTGCGAEFTRR